jgi:hypothetical protein
MPGLQPIAGGAALAPATPAVLRPLPDEALEMYPVNPKLVNSGRIDCPECVQPWVG